MRAKTVTSDCQWKPANPIGLPCIKQRVVRGLLILSLFTVSWLPLRLEVVFFTLSDLFFSILFAVLIAQNELRFPLKRGCDVSYFIGAVLVPVGLLVSSMTVKSIDWFGILQYAFTLCILPLTIISAVRYSGAHITIIKAFVLGVSVNQIIGILILFSPFPDGAFFWENTNAGRLGSLLLNPNALGKVSAMQIGFLLYLAVRAELGLFRAGCLLSVSCVAIAMSASFGAIISAIAAFSVFAVVYGASSVRNIWAITKTLVSISFFGAMYVYNFGIPEILQVRVVDPLLYGGRTGSADYKLYLMKLGWELVAEKPILGYGLGGFREQIAIPVDIHNLFILLWVEGGLISFSGMLMIFLSFFYIAIQQLRNKNAAEAALSLSVFSSAVLVFSTNAHSYGRYWFLPTIIMLLFLVRRSSRTSGLKGEEHFRATKAFPYSRQ